MESQWGQVGGTFLELILGRVSNRIFRLNEQEVKVLELAL